MDGVKFCNQCRGMHLCGILPAIVLIAVALPLDKVLESSPEYLAVPYGLYFIVFLTINKDQVRRRCPASLESDLLEQASV